MDNNSKKYDELQLVYSQLQQQVELKQSRQLQITSLLKAEDYKYTRHQREQRLMALKLKDSTTLSEQDMNALYAAHQALVDEYNQIEIDLTALVTDLDSVNDALCCFGKTILSKG